MEDEGRMPGIDGVEATRRLRERFPADKLRIIVLTTFEHDDHVLAAVRAGANGFLGKGASPAQLVAAIQDVITGGGALSSGAAAALMDRVVEDPPPPVDENLAALFAALTEREREAVVAAASGRSNAEIAAELYLSPYTVKTHINRAMLKVGARDRAQLVAWAFRAGLVRP